jgi:proline iminopeptidase
MPDAVLNEGEALVAMDDGVRLWTVTGGSGSVPVVLCHGGAGLWDYLEPVAAMLSPIARVYRWEQRGCGRSERTGPYSLGRYVADIEFLRRHFGHERWLVVGHSWGAGLALRYALAHPDRTLGVLYVSGTGFGQAWRAAYHEEADRRLAPAQRERRDALRQRSRTAGEEQEWRTLCYTPDLGDRRRAIAVAARFANVPFAINSECNTALNDEEKHTIEADALDRCRALDGLADFLPAQVPGAGRRQRPAIGRHRVRDRRPSRCSRPAEARAGTPRGRLERFHRRLPDRGPGGGGDHPLWARSRRRS